MTPADFVAKWKAAMLTERSAAQERFNDLCRLLREAAPAEAHPTGEWFCFEKGAPIVGGGDGWADMWRDACCGWECKGKDRRQAFRRLHNYSLALEYPPLLIVSDKSSVVIHTAFTGTVLTLHDLLDPSKSCILKWIFTDPQRVGTAG